MVGELVAQRLLDLPGEQLPVVAEVTLEGVSVDHDPILVPFRRNAVAEVLAVGMAFGSEIGDDHRHPLQDPLEFLRKGVDRIGDERFECIRVGLIHCPTLISKTIGEHHMTMKFRAVGSALAVIAIAAGGVVWSGCGGSDSESSTNQAKQEVREGAKKAEEAVKEGAEKSKKGLEEAKEQVEKNLNGSTKKKIEKAREEAEKGVEEGKAQAEKGLEEAKEEIEKYAP
jgi:hypothetical protein